MKARTERKGLPLRSLVVVAGATMLSALVGAVAWGAASDERAPAQTIAETWTRYRSVGTEREDLDILVIAAPPKPAFTKEDADRLLRDGAQGVTHKRAVRHVLYAVDGHDKVHLSFSLPRRDAGTAFLVWREPGTGKDDQWLYLPALRSVRRVPISSAQTFVGTDLIYEDVRELTGERTERFVYTKLPDEELDGRRCKVLEAKPQAGSSSAYASRKIWIDAEWLFQVKVEYFDQTGALWKTFRNTDLYEAAPGVRRARLSEMRNVQINETTLMVTSKRDLRVEIPPEMFTEDYLARNQQ